MKRNITFEASAEILTCESGLKMEVGIIAHSCLQGELAGRCYWKSVETFRVNMPGEIVAVNF